MKTILHRSPRRFQNFAFGLVEVALAIGLVAFVMVVLLGLAGRALASGRESRDWVAASNMAVSILQSWATNPSAPPGQSPIEAMDPFTLDPGDSIERESVLIDQNGQEVASEQDASFKLQYRIWRPATAPKQVLVWLRVSWPASAQSNASFYELLHSIQI